MSNEPIQRFDQESPISSMDPLSDDSNLVQNPKVSKIYKMGKKFFKYIQDTGSFIQYSCSFKSASGKRLYTASQVVLLCPKLIFCPITRKIGKWRRQPLKVQANIDIGWKMLNFQCQQAAQLFGGVVKIRAKKLGNHGLRVGEKPLDDILTYGQSGTKEQIRISAGVPDGTNLVHFLVNEPKEAYETTSREVEGQYKQVLFEHKDHIPLSKDQLIKAADKLNDTINDAGKNNDRVHISCYQGKGRGAAVLTAYLMKHHSKSLIEALKIVTTARDDHKTMFKKKKLEGLIELEKDLKNFEPTQKEIMQTVQLPLAINKLKLAYERGGFKGGEQKGNDFEERAMNLTTFKELKHLLVDSLPSNESSCGRPA